jgi:surface antigen/peptidoglycan hydrolase CwlO-like protein
MKKYAIFIAKSMKHKKVKSTSGFKGLATRSTLIAAAVLMVVAAPMSTGNIAYADRFDEQIKALQQEVDSFNNEAARLRGQADTLQNAVNALNAQKNAIQTEINLNQAKYDQLVTEITANEKKLGDQQKVMASAISDLAADSTTSPIEVLASSKSIGDYIDQQEYRSSIRDQLQTSIRQIKTLKEKLTKQKKEVEQVLNDQKSRRDTLATKEAEQANLLASTRGEEAAYQSMIGQKNTEIGNLRAQQRAANASLGGNVVAGDPGHGGYPAYLDNAPQDSLVDPWGMYNRECVSYTAWKVHQKTGHMPYWGGRGNANEWPSSAQSEGIATGSTPKVGSVAISMSGFYGHAMWVEAVNGNMIYVSQYNFDLAGHYSEMWVNGSNFIYIYF